MKQTVYIFDANDSFSRELADSLSEDDRFRIGGISSDGQEALELLRSAPHSVVTLSLSLKTFDGFHVLETAHAEKLDAQFIVLGNYSDDAVINRIIGLGARYYLMKPVSVSLVRERVASLCSETLPSRETIERRRAASVDERISNIFISIGIPPHIKGYQYLRDGIKMAIENPRIINNITKVLYPAIGEHFQTTASKVERAIRHAIEVTWNQKKMNLNFIQTK